MFTSWSSGLIHAALLTMFLATSAEPLRAQRPVTESDENSSARPRALEIDILMPSQPSYRVKAQDWARVFQELGHAARFRQPRPGEVLGLKDIEDNGIRSVQIIGQMDGTGQISIGGHRFRLTDGESLKERLAEIAAYGATGPPSESPTWALTDAQFTAITELMKSPVEATEPIPLQSPVAAMEALQLPADLSLRFTEAARVTISDFPGQDSDARLDVTGLSQGSALAMTLAHFGLGFRPLVNPAGGFDLEVDAGDEGDNLWPVGWKIKDALNVALPNYFKSMPVDVEDVELTALIQVISDKLNVRPRYSRYALQRAGIDINSLRYSRRPDRLSPYALMQSLGDKYELGLDVRVDEGGHLFMWITTQEEKREFTRRFAHIIPGRP